MRTIIKFAKDHEIPYSYSNDEEMEQRTVKLEIDGDTWIVKDRESTCILSTHGWVGNNDKYSLRNYNKNDYEYPDTFRTQSEIVEYLATKREVIK